ncbi:hypothetical protein SP15_267 [Bacillus phage SP-15]|uniref:Uncharacterized protein n=1 Tax=Bacillus phage SP-15 TaxID=1792032 RepID=A0A127AXY6_9CAUD|nr:hypothetical protein SP15_267 [Bacillus phage SP-15]AMM45074.1 hypothetical protein SP15_267 [Bacillus phage SP-15]
MGNLVKQSVLYYLVDQDRKNSEPIFRIDGRPTVPTEYDDVEINGMFYQVVSREISYISSPETGEITEEFILYVDPIPEFSEDQETNTEYAIHYRYYNPSSARRSHAPALVIKIKEVITTKDYDEDEEEH